MAKNGSNPEKNPACPGSALEKETRMRKTALLATPSKSSGFFMWFFLKKGQKWPKNGVFCVHQGGTLGWHILHAGFLLNFWVCRTKNFEIWLYFF